RLGFVAQFFNGAAAWPAIIQHFTFDTNETQHPWLGTYQRRQSEKELNEFLSNSDKAPDIGWMYTVVAGLLNILVIYDALAGPMFAALPLVPSPSAPAEEKRDDLRPPYETGPSAEQRYAFPPPQERIQSESEKPSHHEGGPPA